MGMTLGIVVDDTVHFLSKYLRARRDNGLSAEEAVRYAFSSVGMALVVTSVILAVGFLVLAQSSFQINSGMGKLTAITILCALLADLLTLPALLVWLEAKTHTPSLAKRSIPMLRDVTKLNYPNQHDNTLCSLYRRYPPWN